MSGAVDQRAQAHAPDAGEHAAMLMPMSAHLLTLGNASDESKSTTKTKTRSTTTPATSSPSARPTIHSSTEAPSHLNPHKSRPSGLTGTASGDTAKPKPTLRLDWCSHQAAKYAVEHWHYSRSFRAHPAVRIGVWEDERFVGCVIFGRGATNNLGTPYGLGLTEVSELVRVALSAHRTPVSRIVAVALRFLRERCPNVRLVVSFADPEQNHLGGIYQAGNWIYTGMSSGYDKFLAPSGRVLHPRQVSATGIKAYYGEPRRVPKIADCRRIPTQGKHRYLYPLDDAMRAQIAPLAKPYPKRPRAGSIVGDALPFHGGEGGSTPTPALHEGGDD